MPRPQTQEEFLTAGYVFLQSMTCQVCGEPTEQFRTPDGRFIEMNPMHQLDSKPVLHSTTCKGPEDKDGRRADGGAGSIRNGGASGMDVSEVNILEQRSKGHTGCGDEGLRVGRRNAGGSYRVPQAKTLSVEESQSLAFTPGAWKHVARPVDMPPKEAIWNLQHGWWRWLDKSEPLSKVASLKEAIP
jgi:hypothetical protein